MIYWHSAQQVEILRIFNIKQHTIDLQAAHRDFSQFIQMKTNKSNLKNKQTHVTTNSPKIKEKIFIIMLRKIIPKQLPQLFHSPQSWSPAVPPIKQPPTITPLSPI